MNSLLLYIITVFTKYIIGFLIPKCFYATALDLILRNQISQFASSNHSLVRFLFCVCISLF